MKNIINNVVLGAILLTACAGHRAIERLEGSLPKNASYIVLVNGDDNLSLAGEVRNGLVEKGYEMASVLEQATCLVTVSYSTVRSGSGRDVLLDRFTMSVINARTREQVSQYSYFRNEEKTDGWESEIQSLIRRAIRTP